MKYENTKTLNSNGNKYEFINGWNHTSYNTTEISELFINGYKVTEGRYTWINRPWQKYDYEIAMRLAIENLIEIRCDNLKYGFMVTNDYKKLTDERRKELNAIYKQDKKLKEYRRVLNRIEKSNGYKL